MTVAAEEWSLLDEKTMFVLCLKFTWSQMGIMCSEVVKLQKVSREKNYKKIRNLPQD